MIIATIVAATAASYALGWVIGIPLAVPILNTLAGFPFMFSALRQGRVGAAIGRMLIWAAAMAVSATALAYWQQAAAERLFIHGEAYRREMFVWLLTGQGAEGDPSRFIPQHLAHAAIFCGLSLATGSLVSMMMGAVLMNYMGCYVGALALASQWPGLATVLGWHPWSVVRIISFVTLGVVLGAVLLARIGRFTYRLGNSRTWLSLALAGLMVDILLKWLLAPFWRDRLRELIF
jgi:hypothetical protein